MEYVINRNGEEFAIPKYSMKIATKLETTELLNNKASADFKSKCKSMYDFCSEMLGKDVVISLIGKFDDSDPNEINILYLDIVKAYNKPLEQYQNEVAKEKFESMEIDKMTELFNSLANSDKVLSKLK